MNHKNKKFQTSIPTVSNFQLNDFLTLRWSKSNTHAVEIKLQIFVFPGAAEM